MSFASNWESDYSRHLDTLKLGGEISGYHYEPWKFLLADKCTYLPDFVVIPKEPGAKIEIHEVKGFMREDSVVKFKVAANMFPCFVFIMIRKEKKGWTEVLRFNDGVRIPKHEMKTPLDKIPRAVAPKKQKALSYADMLNVPEFNRILKLTPLQLTELRGSVPVPEFAVLVGMEDYAWSNLESGKTKLYHHRHVLSIQRLMEEQQKRMGK